MSIGFNKIGGINNIQKTNKIVPKREAQEVSNVKGKKDDLKISKEAMDYQIVSKSVRIVSELPEVREDVVSGIKERVDTGSYNVEGRELADKLLSRSFDKKI